MEEIRLCAAAVQQGRQSREVKKNAPARMYANNVGAKMLASMSVSLMAWASKGKMKPEQAAATLAADAALLRFAIQGERNLVVVVRGKDVVL